MLSSTYACKSAVVSGREISCHGLCRAGGRRGGGSAGVKYSRKVEGTNKKRRNEESRETTINDIWNM